VQLTGVSRATAGADGSVELVRRLSEVSGGAALPIYAPLIVGDARTAARLRQQDEVAEAMRRYDELDVAAISVGSWNPPDSLAYSVWPEPERTEVLAKGVVGEVCARLIDARGKHVEAPSSRRIIAISLDQLASVPEVLLVSGGATKASAIAAALASGFVTSFVTDVGVARILLAETAGSRT
jgi:DNA-binding transcriptional regulator LsrR (DeoR family)